MHLRSRAAPHALLLLALLGTPCVAFADLANNRGDKAIRLAPIGGGWLARTSTGAFVCWRPPREAGPSACFERVLGGGFGEFGPTSAPWRWQLQPSGAVALRSGDALAWLPAGSHTLVPAPDPALAARLLATRNWRTLAPAGQMCTNRSSGVPVAAGQAWSFELRPCEPASRAAHHAMLERCQTDDRARLKSRPGAGVRVDLSVEGFVSRAFERRRFPWHDQMHGALRHRPQAGLGLGVRMRFDPRLKALARRDTQQARAHQTSPRSRASGTRRTREPAGADPFAAREAEALQRARCSRSRK